MVHQVSLMFDLTLPVYRLPWLTGAACVVIHSMPNFPMIYADLRTPKLFNSEHTWHYGTLRCHQLFLLEISQEVIIQTLARARICTRERDFLIYPSSRSWTTAHRTCPYQNLAMICSTKRSPFVSYMTFDENKTQEPHPTDFKLLIVHIWKVCTLWTW